VSAATGLRLVAAGGVRMHTRSRKPLLDVLLSLQRSAPVKFDLVAVNLDQKQPGFPAHVLPEYLAALGVPHEILEQDTYSVVRRVIPEGRTMCGLCSRNIATPAMALRRRRAG
jgi:hypothetical protein